jgi:hypothetical protein
MSESKTGVCASKWVCPNINCSYPHSFCHWEAVFEALEQHRLCRSRRFDGLLGRANDCFRMTDLNEPLRTKVTQYRILRFNPNPELDMYLRGLYVTYHWTGKQNWCLSFSVSIRIDDNAAIPYLYEEFYY